MSFVIPIVSYLCLFLKLNCRRGSLKIIHVFCVKEMTNNFNDNSVCILTISECLFIGKPCTLSVNRAFLCISLDLVCQPKSPPMQCNVQSWIFLDVNLLHGKNCETLIYSHWKWIDFQFFFYLDVREMTFRNSGDVFENHTVNSFGAKVFFLY